MASKDAAYFRAATIIANRKKERKKQNRFDKEKTHFTFTNYNYLSTSH